MHSLILLTLCLQSYHAQAQNVRYVVDAKDKTPVPYAAITSREEYIMTGETGNFTTATFKERDTLTIRILGYKTQELLARNIPDTVYLQPVAQMMKEVVINANNTKKTIGNFTRKHIVRHVGDVPGIEFAVKLPVPAEDANRMKKIISVRIRMKKTEQSNPSILHLYEAAADGMPGKELLTEQILITKSNIKSGYCEIDLSGKKIYTIGSSILVGLEYTGKVFSKENTILPDPAGAMNYRSIIFETLAYPEISTYTRTALYRDWRLVDFGAPEGGNPLNLMASVTYE